MNEITERKIKKAIDLAIKDLKEKNKNNKEVQRLVVKKSVTTEIGSVVSHWINERQIYIVIETEKLKKDPKQVSKRVEENRKKKEIYKKYKGVPKDIVDEHIINSN